MPVAAVPTLSTQCLSRHTYIYSTPVLPYLHQLNVCPAILPTSTQCLSRSTKKRRECFLFHEIGRIDGRRGFQTSRNVFRIGVNTLYDQKNEILMKIPEFKRSRIGIIAEFRGIWSGFLNQVLEFASELPFGLFFGVIGDHGWRYTVALEYNGQGLMSIPLALHRVRMCPTKELSICLGHFVALS
jgi:hypothetical protein